MNLKKLSYKNFKEGLHKVTPLELCNARIAGYIGTIVGAALSLIPLAYNHQWGWVVFIFFVGWLQCAALLGDIQQRRILKEQEKFIKEASLILDQQLKQSTEEKQNVG